ncbi:hypothetical protein SI65_04016 [Aspergillus cristatus]|uniref:Intradiol ring-cleavage dioxygenases domain-containing protein n=1 Tax=Aspergillus cristatus TaxID=573508 RepID=A0A1E3BJ05_ASPCR|nr:hypothetical protein SI65_04016 [Aspergillus cristatus]
MKIQLPAKLAVAALAALTTAHGPDDHETFLAKREYFSRTKLFLDSCAGPLESKGIEARARARRASIVHEHQKRNKAKHDTDAIFAGTRHVLLNPYGDNGPYYVRGELIREGVREDEPGIPIIVKGQFINYVTCEPVEGMCNVNRTALRGLQQADEDGVARLTTIFPGHYSGRTNHIHVIAHSKVTVNPNNTISGGSIQHIGQFFFDEDLLDKVRQVWPYTENPYEITTNAEDDTFHQETAYSNSDPVFHHEYLGDKLEDGLLMWVRIGVNVSTSWEDEYSFVRTAQGVKYSCGTGRITSNYTQDGTDCTNNVDVKNLPGESAPGRVVYPNPHNKTG